MIDVGVAGMSIPLESKAQFEPSKRGLGQFAVIVKERPQYILSPLFAILLFGGWEYACRALIISQLIIPAPSQIVLALIEGFRSGQLLDGLLVTLEEIVLGFALAAIAAFVIGTLISQVHLLELVVYPNIVAIQTFPKVAVAPLILIWVGLGIEGKILIAATVSFFPMLVNTIAGLLHMSLAYLRRSAQGRGRTRGRNEGAVQSDRRGIRFMYRFSRSIYRELCSRVIEQEHAGASSRQHLLEACEATMERLAVDRRYFARPARSLFSEPSKAL